MKLYKDYKTLFRVLLLVILLIAPVLFSCAQTANEINQKISQKNIDIDALEKEIASFQAQLDDLGKQTKSLKVSLAELDLTRQKLNADISVTEKKISNTNLKISGLSSQIINKQNSIENDINAIRVELKTTAELEDISISEIILSKNTFSDAWNDIDNMSSVQQKIKEKITELKKNKIELENTKKVTTEAKNELVALRSELADQKKIVDQNTAEKKKLLAQTKNSETSYQKLLKDRLVKKDAFEKELRDYESQLKYILDPSKLPGGGVLSWPLDNIYVTQMFGKTEAGKRLYATGSHNGTDFRAPVGTRILAMADGTVAGTGNTDIQCNGVSFGRFVLIKYNNGLASTYGHMSLIKVSKGDRVFRGQVVGYSGNTGYSTGPHLHVSLYARDAVDLKTLPSKSCPGRVLTQPIAPINAYLDPLYYLPHTDSGTFK
jgi:murein DD-endopeptidase MepM/ murein hydrolase activator NlpD